MSTETTTTQHSTTPTWMKNVIRSVWFRWANLPSTPGRLSAVNIQAYLTEQLEGSEAQSYIPELRTIQRILADFRTLAQIAQEINNEKVATLVGDGWPEDSDDTAFLAALVRSWGEGYYPEFWEIPPTSDNTYYDDLESVGDDPDEAYKKRPAVGLAEGPTSLPLSKSEIEVAVQLKGSLGWPGDFEEYGGQRKPWTMTHPLFRRGIPGELAIIKEMAIRKRFAEELDSYNGDSNDIFGILLSRPWRTRMISNGFQKNEGRGHIEWNRRSLSAWYSKSDTILWNSIYTAGSDFHSSLKLAQTIDRYIGTGDGALCKQAEVLLDDLLPTELAINDLLNFEFWTDTRGFATWHYGRFREARTRLSVIKSHMEIVSIQERETGDPRRPNSGLNAIHRPHTIAESSGHTTWIALAPEQLSSLDPSDNYFINEFWCAGCSKVYIPAREVAFAVLSPLAGFTVDDDLVSTAFAQLSRPMAQASISAALNQKYHPSNPQFDSSHSKVKKLIEGLLEASDPQPIPPASNSQTKSPDEVDIQVGAYVVHRTGGQGEIIRIAGVAGDLLTVNWVSTLKSSQLQKDWSLLIPRFTPGELVKLSSRGTFGIVLGFHTAGQGSQLHILGEVFEFGDEENQGKVIDERQEFLEPITWTDLPETYRLPDHEDGASSLDCTWIIGQISRLVCTALTSRFRDKLSEDINQIYGLRDFNFNSESVSPSNAGRLLNMLFGIHSDFTGAVDNKVVDNPGRERMSAAIGSIDIEWLTLCNNNSSMWPHMRAVPPIIAYHHLDSVAGLLNSMGAPERSEANKLVVSLLNHVQVHANDNTKVFFDDVEITHNLADSRLPNGNSRKCATRYRLPMLKPERPDAFRSRAFTYKRRGETQKAEDDFSEAIRLEPGRADSFLTRGRFYRSNGQIQEAIDDISEAIRLEPGRADYFLARAHTYPFSKAINLMRRRVEIDAAERLRRGLATADSIQQEIDSLFIADESEPKKVIDDYSEVIRLQPDQLDALLERGMAYQYLGETQNAIDDFSEVLSLQPDSKAAQNSLAMLTGAHIQLQRDDQLNQEWAIKTRRAKEREMAEYLRTLAEYLRTVDEFPSAPELSLENHPNFETLKNDFKKLIADKKAQEAESEGVQESDQ